MTCKDCIHSGVCYKENDYDNFPDRCGEFISDKVLEERPQGDECMTNACYKKQNAKHCNTCLHYSQLTKIQEIGYCEMKNYHVSANSDKCINYKEKQ